MKKLFYIILMTAFAACETVIDVDLPEHKPKIVVNAIASPNSTSDIYLSKTKSIMDSQTGYATVNDATIKFYEGTTAVTKATLGVNGVYSHSFNPVVGKSYRMEINSKELGEVTCDFSIPKPIEISSITTDPNEDISFEIKFNDPQNTDNHYLVSIYQVYNSDSEVKREYKYFEVTDDYEDKTEERYFSTDRFGQLFTDGIYDGEEITFSGKMSSTLLTSTTLYFELHTISEDLYKYWISKEKQADVGNNPFTQTVTVFSNINGGAGILGTYSTSTKMISL